MTTALYERLGEYCVELERWLLSQIGLMGYLLEKQVNFWCLFGKGFINQGNNGKKNSKDALKSLLIL